MESCEGKRESGIGSFYGVYGKAPQEYPFILESLTFNLLVCGTARISSSPKSLVALCFQLIALRCARRLDASDSQTEQQLAVLLLVNGHPN